MDKDSLAPILGAMLVFAAIGASIVAGQRDELKKECDAWRDKYNQAAQTNASIQRVLRFSALQCPEFAEFMVRCNMNQDKTKLAIIRSRK